MQGDPCHPPYAHAGSPRNRLCPLQTRCFTRTICSYLSDIMSYIAVGARSVENQYHRLVASGCDVPVGMKNPTSGDLTVMLNSVVAAQLPHDFIFRG